MTPSRAIIVLGMHRNGTSLLTRGLQELGVCLGNDFLEAKPDNPTGYWEDRTIVNLNERMLNLFGLEWETFARIRDEQWREPALEELRREAVRHLETQFIPHSPWGFKDPRTSLLLPFWQPIFQELGVEENYVVAIRNPLSVARSLQDRQSIAPLKAHLMWLRYMVTNLHRIRGHRFVVVDYDLVIREPVKELARVGARLDLAATDPSSPVLARFAGDFVNPHLRHSAFGPKDFGAIPGVSPLTREAYFWLRRMATDDLQTDDAAFWSAWEAIRESAESVIASHSGTDTPQPKATELAPRIEAMPKTKPVLSQARVRTCVIISSGSTACPPLRSILNTNDALAVVSEILAPCPPPGEEALPPAPDEAASNSPYQCLGTGKPADKPGLNYRGHWGNYLRQLPPGSLPSRNVEEAAKLLDGYFEFLFDQIRRHWSHADKSRCSALGFELAYHHLHDLAPLNWDASAPPFLLNYLESRDVLVIHAARRNVIEAAVLAVTHGTTSDEINIDACLETARWIALQREKFETYVKDLNVIECWYEDLLEEIGHRQPDGLIPAGSSPLHAIASTLGVPFRFYFRDDMPGAGSANLTGYSNRDALVNAIQESEFAEFAPALV